eukprot:1031120-Pyramimonas_sp.AAC.1
MSASRRLHEKEPESCLPGWRAQPESAHGSGQADAGRRMCHTSAVICRIGPTEGRASSTLRIVHQL